MNTLDGDKLLAALRGLIESYDRTIKAAVASEKYGLANDWIMMKSQLEQVAGRVEAGDYTRKKK
tara:strand:- start:355 stop:546 length:192 start_codon:yes stop_codon:yes gene_type:complete